MKTLCDFWPEMAVYIAKVAIISFGVGMVSGLSLRAIAYAARKAVGK